MIDCPSSVAYILSMYPVRFLLSPLLYSRFEEYMDSLDSAPVDLFEVLLTIKEHAHFTSHIASDRDPRQGCSSIFSTPNSLLVDAMICS